MHCTLPFYTLAEAPVLRLGTLAQPCRDRHHIRRLLEAHAESSLRVYLLTLHAQLSHLLQLKLLVMLQGEHTIEYDDGDEEQLDLKGQDWHLISHPGDDEPEDDGDATILENVGFSSAILNLASCMQSIL